MCAPPPSSHTAMADKLFLTNVPLIKLSKGAVPLTAPPPPSTLLNVILKVGGGDHLMRGLNISTICQNKIIN